jgi:hypothetical protein
VRYEDIRRFFARGGKVTLLDKPQREHPPHGQPIEQPVPPPVVPAVDPRLGFPHPYIFPWCDGNGGPLWDNTLGLNATYMAALAKYPYIEIDMQIFGREDTPARSDIVRQLKLLNPKARVSWYWQAQYRYQDTETNRVEGQLWPLVIGPPDIRLYNLDGTSFCFNGGPAANYQPTFHDLAHPGIADATLNIFKTFMSGHRRADGMHMDWAIGNIGLYGVTATLDLTRPAPGYASVAAMNAANSAALTYLMTSLKNWDGGKFMIGNRGGTGYTNNADAYQWDGELFEGWDHDEGQGGGSPPLNYPSYDAAMQQLEHWRGPAFDSDGTAIIKCEANTTGIGPGTVSWDRLVRYGLASATIMGCFACVSPQHVATPFHVGFWIADEYAVDANGHTDTTMAASSMGWLGRPIEFGFKDASGIYVRRFQNGMVLVNGTTGTLSITPGGTWKRIAGAASTTINNGTLGTTFSVGAKDGLFLLRP